MRTVSVCCGAVWQLFNYFALSGEVYTLVFAVVGVGLLLSYRLALVEALAGPLARATFHTGNVLLSLSFVSVALILIGLATPLVMGRVPPNDLYGLRVTATMEDEEIW